jgi:hypothetical protein
MPVKLCGCGGQHYRCADGFLRCKVCGERADTDDMAMPMQRCVCKEPDKEINSLGGIYLWHCKKCKKGGELAKHVVNFPNANATAPLGISLYDLGKGELMVFDSEQGCVRGRKDAGMHPIPDKAKQEEVFTSVKTSGKEETFTTGAVRDVREGKGRFDLIPAYPLERLAKHYENGAKRYSDNNWCKGMPVSRCLDSLLRHANQYKAGMTNEDHLSAIVFNAFAIIYYEEMVRQGLLPDSLLMHRENDVKANDETK